MDLPRNPAQDLAGSLFLLLALIWIALRFIPVAGPPDEAARIVVAAVRVEPSLESGRLRILGLRPDGASTPEETRAARGALLARVEGINSGLSRRASQLCGRIEGFEDGTVALRLAGLAVPFHDHDADRLTGARSTAVEQPWFALRTVSDVLAARLEEPPSGLEIESGVRRRELTRTFREIGDWLGAAEADARDALDIYRGAALEAATPRPDAFRRQGRGRLLEACLAAWLAVTLAAWRRPRRTRDLAVQLAAAAVASLALLLALEGSPLLPVDARGVTPVFLPLSFAIGWAVTRLGRASSPEKEQPIANSPTTHRLPSVEAMVAPRAEPLGAPRGQQDPALREIARDVLSGEETKRPAARSEPVRPDATRSEIEVEEDPAAGPGRRAFGPAGGPRGVRPGRPPERREPEPPPPLPEAAPERLPFFRRRRRL